MILIYYVVDQNALNHHGILGQRWGVRRYQNKDGTRTALGKRRLIKSGTIDLKTGKVTSSTSASESKSEKAKKFIIKHKRAIIVAGSVATYAAIRKIGKMNVNKDNTVKAYAKVGAQTLEKGLKKGVKEGLENGAKNSVSKIISGTMMLGTRNLMDMYVGKDMTNQILGNQSKKQKQKENSEDGS